MVVLACICFVHFGKILLTCIGHQEEHQKSFCASKKDSFLELGYHTS